VIWGERDGSFPVACLQGLERWVPRLQLKRVPEGGHWLLLEQPARVAGLVSAFLEDRP
jgi:pimeloyl-ACP methyl ester carboxylesterase